MRLWRPVQWLLSPSLRRPNRRYDLISETITKPWSGRRGTGPTRDGGVTSDRSESKKR
jgi:hypothetical protein